MPTYRMQAPDGNSYQVSGPEGASDDQVRAEVIKQNPHLAGAPSAAATEAPPAAAAPASGPAEVPRHVPDPFTVAGNALNAMRMPLKAAFDLAGKADVAQGIKTPEQAQSRANTYANIPIPMLTATLTGGASVPANALTQMATTQAMQEGGLEPKSPASVIASGVLPFGMAGLGRLLRGIPRAATRLIPSRFSGAQQAAQTAGEDVAKAIEPQVVTAAGPGQNTGGLFKAARTAGAEKVPAPILGAMLDDLDDSIPKDPTSPGLKTARELMTSARESIKSGAIDLGDLMRLRLDAGRSLKRAPEVAAIYKGILGDLEQAGAAGGPGASLAMQALEAGRKEHGAQLWRDLIEQASKRRSNLTGDLPLLDMAQLAKGVQTNKDQLMKQLGPEGVSHIEDFLVKYRGLPPVDAYNFANKMALGGLGAAGFFGGGPLGAIGTAGLYELLNNAKAVGANPAELNRALIMLGAGARAGLGGMAEEAVKAKR